MPEYLTPAVYVEETSFRSKSIEGVPTSTFGMAGRTAYGPVAYKLDQPTVVMTPKPVLVTSYTEYERMYGDLVTASGDPIYLAHAARAFFENGGRRLYVSRVFPFATTQDGSIDRDNNFASLPVGAADAPVATWRARWPGEAGRTISVAVTFLRSKNKLVGGALKGVLAGAAVEVGDDPLKPPPDATAPVPANIRIVGILPDGTLGFRNAANGLIPSPRAPTRPFTSRWPSGFASGPTAATTIPCWSWRSRTRGPSPRCCRPRTPATTPRWCGSTAPTRRHRPTARPCWAR